MQSNIQLCAASKLLGQSTGGDKVKFSFAWWVLRFHDVDVVYRKTALQNQLVTTSCKGSHQ